MLPARICRQYAFHAMLTMAMKGLYECSLPPAQLPLAPVPHWEPACESSCLNIDVLALRSVRYHDVHALIPSVTRCTSAIACNSSPWIPGTLAPSDPRSMRWKDRDLQEGCLITLGKLAPVIEAPEEGASILGNCSSVSASTGHTSVKGIHEGANKTWHAAAPGTAQPQPSLIAISPASNLQTGRVCVPAYGHVHVRVSNRSTALSIKQ